MKTEELMRYQEMHRALRDRFGVRYVVYAFPKRGEDLGRGEPEDADGDAGAGAQPRRSSCQEPPGRL